MVLSTATEKCSTRLSAVAAERLLDSGKLNALVIAWTYDIAGHANRCAVLRICKQKTSRRCMNSPRFATTITSSRIGRLDLLWSVKMWRVHCTERRMHTAHVNFLTWLKIEPRLRFVCLHKAIFTSSTHVSFAFSVVPLLDVTGTLHLSSFFLFCSFHTEISTAIRGATLWLNKSTSRLLPNNMDTSPMFLHGLSMTSTYDSAESIATRPPESDLNDKRILDMLASQLYLQEREASAYRSSLSFLQRKLCVNFISLPRKFSCQ